MSALGNIIACKCPNCGEAYVFKHQNPYNLPKLAEMYERCPKCDKGFRKEPGFYFGAMYVSYAITSSIVIIFAAVFGWGLQMATLPLIALITALILLTFPLIFRWSRMIWLSWFI